MDESIAKLKLGTFCGRRAARRQLAEAERAVELFPALSRKELARTVCEHPDWRAGSGEDSVHAGLKLLETLESQGVPALPAKRHERKLRGALRAPDRTAAGEPGERLECGLSELGGVSLEAAQSEGGRALSDELADRCREPGHAGRRAAI